MNKWEEKYEKLKNGEFDDRIDELKKKIEDRNVTREEMKEYEKLSKSKNNMNQVKNVIEYRDITKVKLENIKKELAFRENMKKANKENINLEVEMTLLMKEMETISKKLSNPTLSEEDKSKLLNKQNELKFKRDENNKKYVKNEALLNEGLTGRQKELKNFSDEQLNTMKLEAASRISKCNMVCNSLVNGLSWDSIDLKLDNWQERRFTSKEKTPIKEKLEKEENRETEFEDVITDPETLKRNEQLRMDKEKSSFDKKHPRLAKIKNWFKSRFGKKENALPEPIEPTKENDENAEKTEVKTFKEYIKEIAEKGMDGIAAEEKAARQEAAKAKLDEMRKANRASEAKKFGKDYADKSDYRNKDDGEVR